MIFNRKLTAVLLAAAVVVASMTCPSPLPAPPVCVQRTGRLARQAGFPLPSGERVENRDSPLAGQMNQLQVSASQVKLVNQLQVSASQVKLVNQLQVSASQVKLVQMLAPGSRFEEPDSRGDAAVAGIETLHVEFPKILTERGYRLIQGYHRGGSASSTYLAEDRQGRRVVIKYSDWEGISGNGTPWLVRQAERLREIERSFPREARALYPRVLDFYHQGEVAYYAMEYFAGATDITKYYFYDPFVTQEQIRSSVESFLTLMADTHYKHRLEAYPDELRTNMVARLRYRIGLLQKHEGEIYDRLVRGHPFRVGSLSYPDSSYFFERLMGSRYVAINGRVYPNLPILMDILEREGEKLQQMLGPTHYTPFSHGDISLRNVLALPDKSIRIIDVRGQDIHQTSPSKTSVEYDLAKIAYGFFLELVRNGYYQLNAAQGGPVFEFNYKFFNYPGNVRYQAMRKQFYQLLADNAALQGILSTPGSNWLAHVRLGESVHYASDAINRFLQDPTGEHALLYYLAATEGLYAFLKDQKLLPSDLMKEEGNSVVGVNPGDITLNSAADGGTARLSVAEEGASTPITPMADRLEKSKDARGSL